jgi:hypothetical protein
MNIGASKTISETTPPTGKKTGCIECTALIEGYGLAINVIGYQHKTGYWTEIDLVGFFKLGNMAGIPDLE